MNNQFNILPGFTPSDSIKRLKQYGIKEIYTGFYDAISEKKWPVAFHTVNRRGEGSNFYGLNQFSIMEKEARKNNISVYVAFNISYTKEQIPWVFNKIKQVSKYVSVKGIIVADMNLLLLLKKEGYKKEIIISTLGTAFNSYAVSFYSLFGSKRFVLDRQLTAKEIINIITKFPDKKFEVFFLMGDGCLFIDGYCSSMHIQETCAENKYDNTVKTTLCMDVLNQLNKQKKFSKDKTLLYKCNICLLYYLRLYNNVTLKIPNRTITNSTGESIINMILEIETKLNKSDISFNSFHNFCRQILKKQKNIKCNPKICLCRDLYANG